MKIAVSTVLKGVDGVEILKGEKGRPLTIKDICINAVLTPVQEDNQESKWIKYEIYKKLRDVKDEVDLKVEDIALIKKLIGKISPPLIMGQCFELLESGKSK
jgi:hypothetical protein